MSTIRNVLNRATSTLSGLPMSASTVWSKVGENLPQPDAAAPRPARIPFAAKAAAILLALAGLTAWARRIREW